MFSYILIQFLHLVWWYGAQASCWWGARWGKCFKSDNMNYDPDTMNSDQMILVSFKSDIRYDCLKMFSLRKFVFPLQLRMMTNWLIWLCVDFSMFISIHVLMRHLKMQVAEIIKEDLWPNPLKYFNNVSDPFDSHWIIILYHNILPLTSLVTGDWRRIWRRWRWWRCKLCF
jgi:hypothetical protein